MKSKTRKSRIAIQICLIVFCIALIFIRYKIANFDNEYLYKIFVKNQTVQLEGIIVSDPENKKTYWRYEVLIKAQDLPYAKILVKEKMRAIKLPKNNTEQYPDVSDKEGLKISNRENVEPFYGDYIRFTAKLAKPKIIESEDGRDFDYEYFLQKDDIFYLADIEGVQTLAKNQASYLTHYLYKIKKSFMQNIENILPAPYAFLATGLVISGKGSLDKELQEQFQKVGLIHIVVLSGSNVSIVGEAISKFFSFLPKFWGGVFGSLGIILFGMMTGGGATVCRSVIMSIIGIYVRLSNRKNSGFISLMFAGSLMLIHNPKLLLHDPSFQLSFMATLGLIFLASPIEDFLKKTKDTMQARYRIFSVSLKIIPQSLLSLVATCIATQIFTLPFIIRFSGVVSNLALLVNTAVLPFIPLTMLFVFLTGAVSFISPLIAHVPALVSYILLKYELLVVGYFSALSFSSVKLPNISTTNFLLLYFVISLFTLMANSKSIFTRNDTKDDAPKDHELVSVKINTTPV